jgi:predicted nucleic acid-binding protein
MSEFLPDTSCMIAVICTWHEHHERAAKEIARRLDRGETMIAAAPALVEAYAVLTRLPSPYRLSPSEALALLESNFISTTKIAVLDGKSYRTLLRQAPANGIVGGQTYDAVIASCALQAKVATLLTFNEQHFASFRAKGIEVVVP